MKGAIMAKPQGAILTKSGHYGLYLTLTLRRGASLTAVRRACAGLPALTAQLAKEMKEPRLLSAVAFGARAWPRLFKSKPPAGLVPFKAIKDGPRVAPSTPGDIFVHIHSEHHFANLHLARRFMAQLRAATNLVEEVHGFRNFEERDLIGFVDGTENPKGKDRVEAVIVGRENREFAGGTFVTVQRFVHNLDVWERQPVAKQERALGRTKAANIEMDDRVKPATAHIARVVMEENGKELEILRQGLSYGTTSELGLNFIAYVRNPTVFRRMLDRMFRADSSGHYDHLMNFTRPVTGTNYFAPSLEVLKRLS
jgi:putative iron-dependent peroxidase